MAQQDIPPSEQHPTGPATVGGSDPGPPPAPLWLQRLSVVVLVVFRFYIGVLLVLLPWSHYWQDNDFLMSAPALAALMNSSVTRGVVSGLGILDFWIGISELVHFREYRA
jgi:hypothetical protein